MASVVEILRPLFRSKKLTVFDSLQHLVLIQRVWLGDGMHDDGATKYCECHQFRLKCDLWRQRERRQKSKGECTPSHDVWRFVASIAPERREHVPAEANASSRSRSHRRRIPTQLMVSVRLVKDAGGRRCRAWHVPLPETVPASA
jgi:hypothetical protein